MSKLPKRGGEMIYKHFHQSPGEFNWDWMPSGGATVAIDPKTRTVGISVCSPKDQFSKKTGRKVAEGRLAHVTTEPRTDGVIFAPRISERHGAANWWRDAIGWAIGQLLEKCHDVHIHLEEGSNGDR
jgi:hypothetical protein